MKITTVETYHVRHKLPRRIGPSTFYYGERDSLLVKIGTDEGLVGWGETAPMAGTRATIEGALKTTLLGKDPLHHRPLWRQLWGANFGDPLAVGAVDIALNDLRGQALNVPIAELFGGRLRQRVPVYASAMNYSEGVDPLEQYPAEAARLVQERGLRALKMRLGGQPLRRDIAVAQAVRAAVGPDIKLMADGNGAYTLGTAIQMGRALEELEFYWFEEPLPQPGYVGYETLTAALDINIAAGELLGTREAAREVLQRRAMDIVQPDISLCGGIGECLFMAELARLWSIPCVPHAWGGAITLAATIHLLSLLPDASWARQTETPMLEFDVYENPFRDAIVAQPIQIVDGMVDVPTMPGLGIKIIEEELARYQV